MNDKQPVINHNIGEHSKGINNTEQYYESNLALLVDWKDLIISLVKSLGKSIFIFLLLLLFA